MTLYLRDIFQYCDAIGRDLNASARLLNLLAQDAPLPLRYHLQIIAASCELASDRALQIRHNLLNHHETSIEQSP